MHPSSLLHTGQRQQAFPWQRSSMVSLPAWERSNPDASQLLQKRNCHPVPTLGHGGKVLTTTETMKLYVKCPQGDSNPCPHLERVMSLASRRWGPANQCDSTTPRQKPQARSAGVTQLAQHRLRDQPHYRVFRVRLGHRAALAPIGGTHATDLTELLFLTGV